VRIGQEKTRREGAPVAVSRTTPKLSSMRKDSAGFYITCGAKASLNSELEQVWLFRIFHFWKI